VYFVLTQQEHPSSTTPLSQLQSSVLRSQHYFPSYRYESCSWNSYSTLSQLSQLLQATAQLLNSRVEEIIDSTDDREL